MLNCALYKLNAEKLTNLGILKDYVKMISSSKRF